jgi:hypothetical protein
LRGSFSSLWRFTRRLGVNFRLFFFQFFLFPALKTVCGDSGFRQGTASQPAEKAAFVIPNPRRLRVRDLLFAKRPRKKQIPHPVKNQTGFEMTYFLFFPHPVQPCRN